MSTEVIEKPQMTSEVSEYGCHNAKKLIEHYLTMKAKIAPIEDAITKLALDKFKERFGSRTMVKYAGYEVVGYDSITIHFYIGPHKKRIYDDFTIEIK